MNNKGVALIVVLWVMVILEAVVGTFIYVSRLQTKITRYRVEELKRFALAKAGVERMISYLYAQGKLREQNTHLPEVFQFTLSNSLGDGEYTAKVINEESKLNINTSTRELQDKLFLSNGIPNKEFLLDFIFEWRSKHKGFATLSELLLCSALDRPTLEKIEELFTVYGEGKINVNTAQSQVLELLPGLTRNKIQEIMNYRLGEDKIADTTDDKAFNEMTLQQLLGQEIFHKVKNMVCYRAENFKITATGKTEKGKKVIIAFLSYTLPTKTIQLKYWKEE